MEGSTVVSKLISGLMNNLAVSHYYFLSFTPTNAAHVILFCILLN